MPFTVLHCLYNDLNFWSLKMELSVLNFLPTSQTSIKSFVSESRDSDFDPLESVFLNKFLATAAGPETTLRSPGREKSILFLILSII